ncbi:hypothetical protein [Streptomyces sp. NPDC001966]
MPGPLGVAGPAGKNGKDGKSARPVTVSATAAVRPSERRLHALCLDPSLTGCRAVLLPLPGPSLLVGEEAVRAGVQQCARNMGTCVHREVQQGAGRGAIAGGVRLQVLRVSVIDHGQGAFEPTDRFLR